MSNIEWRLSGIELEEAEDCNRWRIQPVIATHSLNRSAGVWNPSVLRGLSFNCLAMALSCCCE
jgi:hypothetical protein